MSELEHLIRYVDKYDIKAIKANIVSVITMSEGLPKETKSDSDLNTVRIITQMNARDEVEHIGPT